MKISCIICTDSFVKKCDMSALQCGHVFHTTCISKWVNDNTRNCPVCRREYSEADAFRLFLTVEDDKTARDVDAMENKLSCLDALVTEKTMEVSTQAKTIQQLRNLIKTAEQDISELQQKYLQCNSNKILLMLKVSEMDKLIRRVKFAEAENEKLKERIHHLKRVEILAFGTQSEVDHVLKHYGPNSTKELAVSCSLLKREVEHLRSSKQELKNKIASRNEIFHEQSQELNCLRQKVTVLEGMISAARNNSSRASATRYGMDHDSSSFFAAPEEDILQTTGFSHSSCRKRVASPFAELHSKTPTVSEVARGPTKRFKVSVAPFERTLKVPVRSISNAQKDGSMLPVNSEWQLHENEDTVVRKGYDGLGGHTRFIKRSDSSK